MKTLFAVEVRRFTARRAMRAVAGIAVLGVLLGASLTFAFSDRDIEGATARARVRAEQDYRDCLAGTGEASGEEPRGFEGKCEAPDPAQITADPRFHLASLTDVIANLTGLLVALGVALGASFVGAEWHHRTMGATLTWEPRRVRVGIAKIAASAALAFAGALAILMLLSGSLVPAAVFRGSTAGVTASWVGQVVDIGIRGAVLAGLAASLGAAIATVVRNTALALGSAFVWIAVIEGIIRVNRPGWRGWLIGDNADGFLGVSTSAPRSGLASGLLLSVYVVAATSLAVFAFRRRDIA